jgi:hypothetical protein
MITINLNIKYNIDKGLFINDDSTYLKLDSSQNYQIFYDNKLIAMIFRKFNTKNYNLNILKEICSKGSAQRGHLGGKIQLDKLENCIQNRICSLDEIEYVNKEKTRCRLKNKKFEFSNLVKSGNLGFTHYKGETKEIQNNKRFLTRFEIEYNDLINKINYISKINYPVKYNSRTPFMKTIFSAVTINYGVRTATHYDSNNKGFSSMIVLGNNNYQGGDLLFPEYKINTNLKINDLILFDSSKILHCNSEFTVSNPERYSLVFFISKRLL